MRYIAGIDIGGTKCAVSIGVLREEAFVCDILYKERFPTPKEPRQAVELLVATLQRMAAAHRGSDAFGNRCQLRKSSGFGAGTRAVSAESAKLGQYSSYSAV